jgi:hypothetical protein
MVEASRVHDRGDETEEHGAAEERRPGDVERQGQPRSRQEKRERVVVEEEALVEDRRGAQREREGDDRAHSGRKSDPNEKEIEREKKQSTHGRIRQIERGVVVVRERLEHEADAEVEERRLAVQVEKALCQALT